MTAAELADETLSVPVGAPCRYHPRMPMTGYTVCPICSPEIARAAEGAPF